MHTFQPTPPARRTLRTSLSAVLLLSLAGLGCPGLPGFDEKDDTTPPTDVQVTGGVSVGESVTGQRTLTATAKDDSGKVSKVEFYVSGALACADVTVRDSGASFSCTWDASATAQGSYQLTAKAYDAAGNATESAPISFTIPAPNLAPTISQVTSSHTFMDEGSSTTLMVTASDPEGDALTYSWTQSPAAPAGTFSGSGASRTWTAPILSADTTFTLQVTVSDGKGNSTQGSTTVTVSNVASLNRPPTVDAAIAASSTSVLAGDTVNLSIGASDPDGDPLTYSWTSTPISQGLFTDPSRPAVQWRSTDVGTPTTYKFQVTVSDGTDSVTRSVDVQVGVPQYARDIQPIWNAQCISCHVSSRNGALNLDAPNSYASLVNVSAAGSPCGTTGLKRVVPGQPDNSLLALKIGPNPPCGSRMPQFDPDYFDRNPGELTRIRSWILAGAPNN